MGSPAAASRFLASLVTFPQGSRVVPCLGVPVSPAHSFPAPPWAAESSQQQPPDLPHAETFLLSTPFGSGHRRGVRLCPKQTVENRRLLLGGHRKSLSKMA